MFRSFRHKKRKVSISILITDPRKVSVMDLLVFLDLNHNFKILDKGTYKLDRIYDQIITATQKFGYVIKTKHWCCQNLETLQTTE